MTDILKVTVNEVLKGNVFLVTPEWFWDFNEGDKVRAKGFAAPDEGHPHYEKVKKKSKKILQGKVIELKNPEALTREGQLLCDVFVEGKNITDFFPEYRSL